MKLYALKYLLGACAGPPTLQRSVIGYDEKTARLDQQLLLLNIARVNSSLPIHFTTTSSIAATFDWTSTWIYAAAIPGAIFRSVASSCCDVSARLLPYKKQSLKTIRSLALLWPM